MKRKNMRGVVDLLILGTILSISGFLGVMSKQDNSQSAPQASATIELTQSATQTGTPEQIK